MQSGMIRFPGGDASNMYFFNVLPDDLPDLPRELSFWIGAHLGGPVAAEQQRLLEIGNTKDRLQREFDMLDQTRRHLAARTAIKDSVCNVDQANNQ